MKPMRIDFFLKTVKNSQVTGFYDVSQEKQYKPVTKNTDRLMHYNRLFTGQINRS